MTGFLLVPKRQYIHSILGWIEPVHGDETGITEADDQLAQLGHVIEWPPDFRIGFQQGKLLLDHLSSTAGGKRIFFSKE
jgi:hypothetical protein